MLKLRTTIWICFLLIVLFSCQQEKGSLTSVTHRDVYIFGVWNAPSTEIAREAIAEVSDNIKRFDKNRQSLLQNGTKPKGSEDSTIGYMLPHLTTAKPEMLLPKDGEVVGWVRSHKPTTYDSDTLYKDRFVPDDRYPQIYYDYGFQRQAEVEYQSPKFGSVPYILLEIFDMGTPENAFGIFSINSYPQPKYEWVGGKALVSGKNLWFWKGKYFIQIEGYAIATGIRKAMIELGRVTAKRIEDPPQKIPILELLPFKHIRGSEKFFMTNNALQQINKTLPQTFPQLAEGAIGVLAQCNDTESKSTIDAYNVFVIRFPNVDRAQSAFTQYQNALMTENVSFETDSENGTIFINE